MLPSHVLLIIVIFAHSYRHITENQSLPPVLEVKLLDVSPVTFAAYPTTDVQARSLFMNSIGIDAGKLNQALIRVEHRLELIQGDEDIIKTTIEKLNSLLPSMRTHKDEENENLRTQTSNFLSVIRQKIQFANLKIK